MDLRSLLKLMIILFVLQYLQIFTKVHLENMQDENGFFYYQLKKGISSKIPYMRWSNAFMFYAMSFYLMDTTK